MRVKRRFNREIFTCENIDLKNQNENRIESTKNEVYTLFSSNNLEFQLLCKVLI